MNRSVNEIREALFAMRDEEYRKFHSKLMPTVDESKVIGVRTPSLRAYAKKLSGSEEAVRFMQLLPHEYYEENNLHAFLIEGIGDYGKTVEGLESFLSYIDNWATCDMLSPKCFKRHTDELYEKVKIWLKSPHVYTARFGVNMLMKHFLDENFEREVLELVVGVEIDDYYIRMVKAWFFATALAKQYDAAVKYIESNRLDLWTHNKTIQKSVESYRISEETKTYLKGLRR